MKRVFAVTIPTVLILALAAFSSSYMYGKSSGKKRSSKNSSKRYFTDRDIDPGPFAGKTGWPYGEIDSASQIYRVEKGLFQAAVTKGDHKATSKHDDFKAVMDMDMTAYQAVGVYKLPNTLRFGLSMDKADVSAKYTVKENDMEGKIKFEETATSVLAAYPVKSGLVVGAKFTSISNEQKTDASFGDGIQSVSKKGSDSHTEFHPSITRYDATSELTLSYTPSINIDEEDISSTSAATVTLQYWKVLASDASFIAILENSFSNAIDSDEKNRQRLLTGMTLIDPICDYGFLINYTHKNYMEKEYADTDNIGGYGLTLFGSHHFDKTTDIDFAAEYRTAEDKGEESTGETVKLKFQQFSYMVGVGKTF